jgi:hypothetical protein
MAPDHCTHPADAVGAEGRAKAHIASAFYERHPRFDPEAPSPSPPSGPPPIVTGQRLMSRVGGVAVRLGLAMALLGVIFAVAALSEDTTAGSPGRPLNAGERADVRDACLTHLAVGNIAASGYDACVERGGDAIESMPDDIRDEWDQHG